MSRATDDAVALIEAYRAMTLIRRFEEFAGKLYAMGEIVGFCHLCIGQEAICVGVRMAMGPTDRAISSYRCHGHALAAGVTPRALLAELLGRSNGVSGGKGGSMHVFSPENGFFGGFAMSGAQAPIGVGLAFTAHYLEDNGVAVIFVGDGAALQGQVLESMGLASALKLPAVFVIENNAVENVDLSGLGAFAGVQGLRVDGEDIEAVRDASANVLEQCRRGSGPQLLDVRTVRYRGHSMARHKKYGAGSHTQSAAGDPIEHLRRRLLEVTSVSELEKIDAENRAIVNDAAEFARNSAEPTAEMLLVDVLAPG